MFSASLRRMVPLAHHFSQLRPTTIVHNLRPLNAQLRYFPARQPTPRHLDIRNNHTKRLKSKDEDLKTVTEDIKKKLSSVEDQLFTIELCAPTALCISVLTYILFVIDAMTANSVLYSGAGITSKVYTEL